MDSSSGAAGGTADPSGSTHAVRDTVALNPVERELFDTLLAAVAHAGSGTVLRCAGGWVRDKLLGRDSDDIDIALDNMLGKDFAELVNEYLRSVGRETRTAAVIHSNPDQSKHLETARMKINDVWIDLVNLRSETYASDSRIPTMEFGTPEQDAMRRDFTINALFYNITSGGVVEDLTGSGLQDLHAGLIRTPLPPMETFLDDPLRVLRAVRFATRFGFQLHHDIMQAAASEQVRTALATKISKERVGTELEGMFNGPSPVAAVRLLHALNLFNVVFALPPPLDVRLGLRWDAPSVAATAAAEALLHAEGLQVDKEERRFYLLAALMLPLRGLQHAPAKGKPVPAIEAVIRDSIKWRVKDIEMTAALHDGALRFAAAHELLERGYVGTAADVRLALGSAIRKLKAQWRLGLLLAPISTMRAATPLPGGGGAPGAGADSTYAAELSEASTAARHEVVRQLSAAVEAYGLQDCWQWKPLMDGKQVMSCLGWSKPGPEMGKVMAAVVEWQLVNPALTLAECEAKVKASFGAQ